MDGRIMTEPTDTSSISEENIQHIESELPNDNGAKLESNAPPIQWTVSDVTSWLELTGFRQYRRKFIHHSIEGRLLLQLTDHQLKHDLAIGPLGHRHALLLAIGELKHLSESITRPKSAPVHAHSQKADSIPGDQALDGRRGLMLTKIKRVQSAIAQRKKSLQDMTSQLRTDEAFVNTLTRELSKLNTSDRRRAPGYHLNQNGQIPWYPVGAATATRNLFPERQGTPRDHTSINETFHPQINTSSTTILQNSRSRDKSFLERLSDDIESRRHKKKLIKKLQQERERMVMTDMTYKKDVAMVCECLREAAGEEITADGLAEYLNEAVENGDLLELLNLDSYQIQRIQRAKDSARISALAAGLRTQRFMESYRSVLQSKNDNLEELKKKCRLEMRQGHGNISMVQRHLEEFSKTIETIGWKSEAIDDAILNALLQRSILHKEVEENGKNVDWAAVKDGMGQEQDAQQQKKLQTLVERLSGAQSNDLRHLLTISGTRKRIGIYRELRSQEFLSFVARDIEERQEKIQKHWKESVPERKVLSKEQVDQFFDRLNNDGIKRKEKRERQIADKQQKEEAQLRDFSTRASGRRSLRRR